MKHHRVSILVCCDEFPPKVWGGMSRSVESVVIGLSELPCQVDVITHRRQQDSQSCIVDTDHRQGHRVSWCRYPLCSPDQIAGLVNVSMYDVLYVNGRGFAKFAAHASDAFQTKVVYSSRSDFYQEVRHGSYTLDSKKAQLQETLIALSDRIVVASVSEMLVLKERYQLSPERIRLIPNPLHPGFTREKQATDQQQRGRVLFAGRYVEQKGIRYLIEAIPKVIAHNSDAHFVFVGGHGNQQTLDLLHLAQSRFGSKVELKDWLSLDNLITEYHRSQVVVAPSLYEPFGNVALEAMACGCVVVGTSVGGLAETITDHITGLLVRPEDSDAIASAVIELVENDALRQYLGMEAKKKALQDYSYSSVSKKLLQLFKETIGIG